ncbi:hypothetical protein AB0L53_44450 [Nonomuraea sp. NPDC052129]|uniref:hypothetical protein n=1 Tax=Nonomuraea sp. NPDC052129 TaxID=3154651 RepID=UPI00341966B5
MGREAYVEIAKMTVKPKVMTPLWGPWTFSGLSFCKLCSGAQMCRACCTPAYVLESKTLLRGAKLLAENHARRAFCAVKVVSASVILAEGHGLGEKGTLLGLCKAQGVDNKITGYTIFVLNGMRKAAFMETLVHELTQYLVSSSWSLQSGARSSPFFPLYSWMGCSSHIAHVILLASMAYSVRRAVCRPIHAQFTHERKAGIGPSASPQVRSLTKEDFQTPV